MKLTIEHLPPVSRAEIELRPLTLFIGPNNSGKSRVALALYAMVSALSTPFRKRVRGNELDAVERALRDSRRARVGIPLPDLSHARRAPGGAGSAENISSALHQHFRDCLVRHFRQDIAAYLAVALEGEVREKGTMWGVSLKGDGATLRVSFDSTPISGLIEERFRDARSPISDEELPLFVDEQGEVAFEGKWLEEMWTGAKRVCGIPAGDALYQIAGRGALAATWAFYVDVALDRASRASGDDLLPAIYRDYLRSLNRAASRVALARPHWEAPNLAIDVMERDILKGRIAVESAGGLPGRFTFSNIFDDSARRFTIDLASASSSVSQLGPLSLMLKSLVRPGDLLVIDEPEAHLHPENVRHVARLLVRLANAGVYVVAPTHSAALINEVGNLARASLLNPDTSRLLEIDPPDRISPDSIAIYEFVRERDGHVVRPVQFERDFGYSEGQFYAAAAKLSDESYKLDVAINSLASDGEQP